MYGLEDTKHLGYGLASYLLSKDKILKMMNMIVNVLPKYYLTI